MEAVLDLSHSLPLARVSQSQTSESDNVPRDQNTRLMIQLDDVHLSLGAGPSQVDILKGVDLRVPAGRSVGLLGPSGSGKSTLLMAIGGLERVDRGTVRINDTDLTTMNEDALARFRGANIGVVFQSFHLLPTMTALENVAVPLELQGKSGAFARARDELRAVGLGERLSHYPGQLSGGEQQRVAIARALAPQPAVLIADEPTGNLDEATGDSIADLLFALQRDRGSTLLLVTHNTVLADACDDRYLMHDGRVEVAS